MKKKSDIIAIYTRKSKFTGKGESIGNQAELCRDYIRMHYGDASADSAVVYEDEGYSGGTLNRPEFKKMMAAVRKHEYKAIIVYRLDRISRSIGDFSNLIQELGRLDVDFVSIREQFDTESPIGRAMMYIVSIFSQLERETIAERIRDNMRELAKTGRWLGGTTPTGYASEKIVVGTTEDGKERYAFKLSLLPEEAEIVKLIFNKYIEYDSLTKIETELLQMRLKTKKGKDYKRFTIKAILQNPAYVIADESIYQYFSEKKAEIYSDRAAFDGLHGLAVYNRTNQDKGQTTVDNPVSEWIVSVGRHEGIIPAELWIKVQNSLDKNKEKGYRKPRSNEALFTGLLYCRCGARMYPRLTARNTVDGERIYTYMCDRKDKSRRELCNCRNANGNTLDAAIIDQLKLLGEDKSEFTRRLEQGRRMLVDGDTDYENALLKCRQELTENEEKMRSLIDSLQDIDSKEARTRISERIEALGKQIEDAKQNIIELEGVATQTALSEGEFDTLKRMLAAFHNMIDEMPFEQKRQMVRSLVRKITWDGENVHVYLFGAEGDAELPENDVDPVEGGIEEDVKGENRPPIVPEIRRSEDSK